MAEVDHAGVDDTKGSVGVRATNGRGVSLEQEAHGDDDVARVGLELQELGAV